MEKFSKREAYRNGLALLESMLTAESVSNSNNANAISFHGFGALKELLLPLDNLSVWSNEDLRYEKEVRQFHELLQQHFNGTYKNALASLKNSILSSFYTPEFIIQPIVESLKQQDLQIKSILEPAAGTGNFVAELKKQFPLASITAIEKDDTTFKVLKSLHPDIETIHSGYENFRNRSYDAVISNIPFGNINVFDDAMFREAVPAKIKATTRIHNYYFVKSLDNLREGGMLVFVAPVGVMDSPGNKEVREYLMKNAELLSAVRLPNTVFEQAGTYPVTDIVLLQKNSQKKNLSASDKLFTTSDKVEVLNDKGDSVSVDINSYYLENRSHILGTLSAGGQYDGRSLDVNPLDGASSENIRNGIANILSKHEVRQQAESNTSPIATDVEDTLNVLSRDLPDHELLKRGNLIVHKGKVGTVDFEGVEKVIRPQPIIKDLDRTFLFTGLRNTLNRLVQAELDGNVIEMKKQRSELNARYDLFVFRYGNINHPSNKKLLLLDAEGFKVLSLERLTGKSYGKADIFQKQVNNVERVHEKPQSLKDAILLSLNAHNGIDMNFISSLLERDKNSVIREGLDTELLFRDPQDKAGESYVTHDEFLSGNVVRKMELLEELGKSGFSRENSFSQSDVDLHLERLQEVRPAFLKRELIDINIGERWIPMDIYESFAEHLFKNPTEINYMGSSDMFLVNVKGYSNEEEITYAASTHNGKITGSKIMEYAMADTQPYLQIRVPDTETPQYVPDADGMKNVEMKIKEVKEAFENFLNDRKDISQRIEELYNRNINNSVRRNYDGSHLQLTGLRHFSPRPHQKDALWMILQQDGGIIDHKVGAGKTLVMITGAMEMRRLGIAQKPLLLCMKANVADIASDFLKAYPSAKILAPDPQKDFTRQRRQGIFASIAANDWDAVIMTHDMFQAIPQSPQIKKEVLSRELENLEDDLRILSDNKTLSKRILKGLETRKQNLTVRLKEADASIRRDENILDFGKMGFDHIFVDESQEYKNLHFTTRHQKVAGLGDPEGSQRALNLEFAIRTIQEKKGGDKGVTFLSGTTISNSLVEMYLLFKYQRPQELEELRINSFDSWAKMYARKSATYEFSVTNELKMKERYREFIKVPELARFYAEISHVVTDANLKVDKPKVENVVVNIEPTVHQQEYTQKLIQFTKTKNPAFVDLPLSEKEMNAMMLIATNLARKMSIDMRLIDAAKYPYETDGKLNKLCEVVSKEYKASSSYKGTQLIFSDIGTPGGSGFNLYAEIKHILMQKHGVSADEIQFIHDHDSKKKREELFRKVNTGEVRILIGSTKKLGTGVNVQERVIAMHHLDIPWRPSDLEQRTGRGGRQGNVVAKEFRDNTVMNYIYAVNRTLDSYQFNILSNKQKFISQIKNNSIDQRKIDEGAFDQEGGMNFGEYVALLSGNTDLLEKVKLEKKLYDLERSYQVFMKRKSEAEFEIGLTRRDIAVKENALTRLQADWSPIHSIDLEKVPVVINGNQFDDRKVTGELLLHKIQGINREGTGVRDTVLAKLMDFELLYDPKLLRVYVAGKSGQVYNYADGKLNESPALAGRYMIDSIKRIPKIIENTVSSIDENKKRIVVYEKEISTEFKDKGSIKAIKHQIDELNLRIEKAMTNTSGNEQKLEGKEQAKEVTVSMQRKYRR
jgi:N12 class adenine-specific DNA methylase/adenine-specific DNA methylase